MPDVIAEGPFWLVFSFLTVVVFLRAQGTYWLGRWATSLTLRHARPRREWQRRLVDRLEASAADQGIAAIHRWGIGVVPVSFLTVGFQTMVNASGAAAGAAARAAAAGAPWGIAGMVAAAIVVTASLLVRRRRRNARATHLRLVEPEAEAA